MAETENLKLFIHDDKPYEIDDDEFDYRKSIAEPYQKIDEFAGETKDKDEKQDVSITDLKVANKNIRELTNVELDKIFKI